MWPRRMIASLLIVVHLSACYSWKPSKVSPEQTVQEASTIQVQLTDGSKVGVRNPWIRGDTLGGEQFDYHSQFRGSGPWAVSMDSVAVIKIPERNTVVTVVYMAVASVAAVAALTAMYYSGTFD